MQPTLPADVAIPGRMRTEPRAGTVVVRHTARKALRSGVLWGYIFGVVVASSILSYPKIYKTQAERDRLAASFRSNHASSALFGPAPQLQTVAGFTVFKVSMTLMILGSVWGLLISTRLLRGEEESGRWELLLTGRTTRRGAAAQALAGLAAGVVALWAITAVITIIIGQSSSVNIAVGPALFLALALVSSAMMFLALGAFTSQLAATRRQAATYAAVFLGVSYAVRTVADAGVGLHWFVWISPLGWVEELQPLIAPRPLALLPIFGLAAGLAAGAIHQAGTRDVGASTLPDRASSAPHVRLLFGSLGLTLRLLRPTIIGWGLAIGASGLLYGVVAKTAGSSMSGSSVQKVFSRLGAPGIGAKAFIGVSFLILAVLVGFVAAGQVTAARVEEAEGRLDQLLVQPVSRSAWFAGRLIVAVAAAVASGLIGGVFTWFGAASQHSEVTLPTLVSAGLNIVPPAVCILGIGALAIGVWPRRASVAVYSVLGWSLLVEVVGGIGTLSHWLLDTSVFHQMASAPAVSPNWQTSGVMVAAGVMGALIGGFALRARDLLGE